MRAAGFESKDLRVRAGDDGDVSILCFASKDEQIERIDAAVAAGLTVKVYRRRDGSFTHPDYYWDGRAQKIIRDL